MGEAHDAFHKLGVGFGQLAAGVINIIFHHPGCTERDMRQLKRLASRTLRINPKQVQIFTPTPSNYSSLMYYAETDPFTGEKIFVEKDTARKERQKNILVEKKGKRG